MKKICIVIFSLLILASCGASKAPSLEHNSSQNNNTTSSVEEKVEKTLLVSSSIVPISSVVDTIGGKYIEVNNIVPAGVSPHGFDLSVKMIAEISKSEKVFMVGLEHIDGFLNKATSEDKQVHLADGMKLIEVEGHDHHDDHGDEHSEDEHKDEDAHEDEDHHDEDEDEDDHSSDPHVWLGKDNIIAIAKDIRDELTALMPDQAEYFGANTQAFIAELEALYDEFAKETEGKIPKEFIVFHDAYNYLMQSVGMDLNLKVPFSENVLHSASTGHMAELIEEVELHGIENIFSEPQFSSGNIEKFAREYNLTLSTLDPQGINPIAGGYIQNIKNNLDALAKIYE